MECYVADVRRGKKIYKHIRKNFKRYGVGMAGVCLNILVILFLDYCMFQQLKKLSQLGEILILCAGVDLPLLLSLSLFRALAISGGRDILMKRIEEKCGFTEDSFFVSYIPKTEGHCPEVEQSIRYKDILSIEYEEQYGRLAITGAVTIRKLDRNGQVIDSMAIEDVPLYLYEYYPDFRSILHRLRREKQKTCCKHKESV